MDSRSRRTATARSGNSPEDRLPFLRPSSQYSFVACRPVSGSIRGLRTVEGTLLRTPGAGRRIAGGGQAGELEPRLRRGSRRGHRRQPYSLQIGPDRGRIGQGGDDSQATAACRALAEVGGKHPPPAGSPSAVDGRRPQRSSRRPPRPARHPAWAGTMRSRARARGARTPW